MKKNILWMFVGVVFVALLGAGGEAVRSLQTSQIRYYRLRAEANEDTSLVTLATAGDYANKPSTAVAVDQNANAMQMIFCGGAAENKTFTWTVYAWRDANGPAELVSYGTGTLGTQQVVLYPDTGVAPAATKYWADTLVITSDVWIGGVSVIDGDAGNRVAKLKINDGCGYRYWTCEITNADGATGTEAALVSVFYSYY